MYRLKLLIIDDFWPTRTVIRQTLSDLPHVIYESGAGERGRVCYERCHPDWVIMDIRAASHAAAHDLKRTLSQHPEAKFLVVKQSRARTSSTDSDLIGSHRRIQVLPNLLVLKKVVESVQRGFDLLGNESCSRRR